MAKEHFDRSLEHEELEEAVKSPMFLDDGRSIPKETQEAIAWLAAHSF